MFLQGVIVEGSIMHAGFKTQAGHASHHWSPEIDYYLQEFFKKRIHFESLLKIENPLYHFVASILPVSTRAMHAMHFFVHSVFSKDTFFNVSKGAFVVKKTLYRHKECICSKSNNHDLPQ